MPAEIMADMTATRKKTMCEARLVQQRAATDLVRSAKEQGLELTGPNGLLKQFTATVLEASLDEGMAEHLGRAKHEKTMDGTAENTRNVSDTQNRDYGCCR